MRTRRAFAFAIALVTASCGTLLGADEDDVVRGGDAATTISSSDASVDEDASVADAATIDVDGGVLAETGADVVDAGRRGCLGDAACQRYVFVTSNTFVGTFGGLTEGDALCQTFADSIASDARLKNRLWRAWLSTDTTSAGARLVHGSAPYKRVDDSVVALTFFTLTNGTLVNPISLDETNTPQTGEAWTGTDNTGGSVSGVNCGGWASQSANGKVGNASAKDSSWTGASDQKCDQKARLYCFEY